MKTDPAERERSGRRLKKGGREGEREKHAGEGERIGGMTKRK